jgi:hypothetical protein
VVFNAMVSKANFEIDNQRMVANIVALNANHNKIQKSHTTFNLVFELYGNSKEGMTK